MDRLDAAGLQPRRQRRTAALQIMLAALADADEQQPLRPAARQHGRLGDRACRTVAPLLQGRRHQQRPLRPGRSEERRVGKECVSTCRSLWSPYHAKQNTTKTTNKTK